MKAVGPTGDSVSPCGSPHSEDGEPMAKRDLKHLAGTHKIAARFVDWGLRHAKGSNVPDGVLLMLVALGLVAVTTRFSWAPVFDEFEHHGWLRLFAGVPKLEVVRTYSEAVGPLFYWVYANVTAIVDFPYPLLRLVTVVFGLLCLMVLARFELDLFLPKRRLSLVLLASPYFFTLSMLFMSDVMALLCVLVAALLLVRAVAREPALSYLELGGAAIALGLAEYVRQYYLVFAASLIAFALIQLLARRRSIHYAAVGIAAVATTVSIYVARNREAAAPVDVDDIFQAARKTVEKLDEAVDMLRKAEA